jgi:signal transduction histidine kinase
MRLLSVSGAPLTSPEGDPEGAVFIMNDVTERRQHEHELMAAKERAEEMNRLKNAFLANMSHEIRTPLTSIIGFAEVIEDEMSGTEGGRGANRLGVQRFAQLIRDSSLRLKKTLDSVLQLSELEASTGSVERVEVERVEVDPAEQVRAVAADMADRARTAGITLETNVHSTPLLQLPGEGLLRRILQNLVDNALKFTPEGGTVTVFTVGSENGVWVEVEDSGVGMSPAFQEQMFHAFKQESEGLRRRHEGSGLGLAIVDKLVDLADGSIEVESTPEQGTRFAVFLPV